MPGTVSKPVLLFLLPQSFEEGAAVLPILQVGKLRFDGSSNSPRLMQLQCGSRRPKPLTLG